MLTKIKVENFKKIESLDIDLDSTVIFVGPNNSGKTSALQAIALWTLAVQKWTEKRKKTQSKKRIGAVINRKDILASPVISSRDLWYDLQVRKGKKPGKGQGSENILMEIKVEGFTRGKVWSVGFEFDYSSSETLYCRMIQGEDGSLDVPTETLDEKIGFLPPMSGLATIEDKLETGSIESRIGEGRTAEVLRNLCYNVFQDKEYKWNHLVKSLKDMFEVEVQNPSFDPATGQISMSYKEKGRAMDIASSGKGFQQILLLFSYIYARQNTALLLDEPDAHLEVVRQKEIFNLLSEIVRKEQSQLIVATHSEAILNDAPERDKIIAFLGQPHVVNKKGQLLKSLTTIGFDQYLQAENKKCIIYLEGATDLQILKAFAEVLNHPVQKLLNQSFVKYVGNVPPEARHHFFALQEAVKNFKGIALFDRVAPDKLQTHPDLKELMWTRREIENYIPIPEALQRYAQATTG